MARNGMPMNSASAICSPFPFCPAPTVPAAAPYSSTLGRVAVLDLGPLRETGPVGYLLVTYDTVGSR